MEEMEESLNRLAGRSLMVTSPSTQEVVVLMVFVIPVVVKGISSLLRSHLIRLILEKSPMTVAEGSRPSRSFLHLHS